MIASLISMITGSHVFLIVGAIVICLNLVLGAVQALLQKLGDANAANSLGKVCSWLASIITWCGFNQ